jgi:hypothetical protein
VKQQIAKSIVSLDDRIAELDAQIFKSIADRRKASIEAGRAFNELRSILGHGKWLPHFQEVFGPTALKLRTAQRWMKRARKADADSKNDNVSHFKTATDPGAQEIKEAAEKSKAISRAASDLTKPSEGARLYSLPLHLTSAEHEAMDSLQTLADWPSAEKRILRLLRRLWIEYGVTKKLWRRS